LSSISREVLADVEALLAAAKGAPEFLRAPAIDGARTPSSSPWPSLSLGEGDFLGPYRIAGIIASGAMGQMYAALDTRPSRKVAVKVLPPEFAQDPERTGRFAQECSLLAA
jgi:serine/threonine-protein kinase